MVLPVEIGLLIIRGSNEVVRRKLQRVLELAASKVRQKLYVHLEERDHFKELLPAIYLSSESLRSGIDFRVLLDKSDIRVDRVFYDEIKDPDHPNFPIFKEVSCQGIFNLKRGGGDVLEEKPYNHVILGGTFDRLHSGHKILLSEAILLAKSFITCGITDGEMNRKKILYELIEPVNERCAAVENFVSDVSDTVKCISVPIYDPFGPSIEDNGYQAIVVSEETLKGGEAVNEKRKEKNLTPLKVHTVGMLGTEELADRVLGEVKLSSSTKRRAMLGEELLPPGRRNHRDDARPISSRHYLIGLTGGIASGKTHIAKFLASQGCEVIECDTLVHKLYSESEELRNKLAAEFGPSILSDGNVDRRALSELVFKDKQKLLRLDSIVWPLAAERVMEAVKNSKKEIVVVDAALLLEAGWDKHFHQIWCVFVPRDEAVGRVCARDGVGEEQAIERLNNQLGNDERIARSDVVFCSLWEYAETERQVTKALNRVKNVYVPKMMFHK